MVRKANGFFTGMGEQEIINYVSENYSGKTISEFQEQDPAAYRTAGENKVIDRLVEEKILIRTLKRGVYTGMTNAELMKYISDNYSGKTLSEVQRQGKQAYKIAHRRELIDQLVCDNILLRVSDRKRGVREKENSWYKNWGDFELELKSLINQLGHFPTAIEVSKYRGLLRSGIDYYGGFPAVRKRLGVKQLNMKPRGYWKDFDKAVEEITSITKRNNLEGIPGAYQLTRLGYSGLADAIKKHHGGFPAFRERLARHTGRRPEKEEIEGLLEKYVEGKMK